MITITHLDPVARSVTFSANGQTKTITGLGEFRDEKSFIEYLEAVARVEMSDDLAPLPDMAKHLNKEVESASIPAKDEVSPDKE